MRRATLLLVLGVVVAACGGQTTILSTVGTIVGEWQIVARDTAFETDRVEVPANVAIGLQLDNRDSQPHNIVIAQAGGEPVFSGEIFSGPATRMYEVPALAPGTYVFACAVHPGMRGTLVATP